MDTQARFISANEELDRVVARIDPQQMDQPAPDEVSWTPGQTLRDVVNILAYENHCVPRVLAGEDNLKTNPEFGGDLLGDAPLDAYRALTATANQAARTLDDPERVVHMSYGDAPARDYLRDITIQRGLAALDLGRFLDDAYRLPDDLAQCLWEIISPIAGDLREFGVFGPALEVSDDAPLQDRLLGLTGRRP